MRILFNLFYFIVFLILAVIVMFLGGVSGVAGTFYLMVEEGDLHKNLIIAIAALSAIWLIVLMLRSHNKKVIRRNKLLQLKAREKE